MFSSATTTPYVQQQHEGVDVVPPPPPLPGRSIENPHAAGHPLAMLPEGWTTACDPVDGRMYYWNVSTGETSWTHPTFSPSAGAGSGASFWQPSSWFSKTTSTSSAVPPPKQTDHHPFSAPFLSGGATNHYNTQMQQQTARRPPDNHECYSVMALLLCFPIGLLACYHSLQVNRTWEQGRYGQAYNHSRQASKYACAGTALGCCFWFFFLVIRPESKVVDWQWPDWNFD